MQAYFQTIKLIVFQLKKVDVVRRPNTGHTKTGHVDLITLLSKHLELGNGKH